MKYRLAALLFVLTCMHITLVSQTISSDIYDLTPDENINTPAVPGKHSPAIVRHIDGLINYFKKLNITAQPKRKGEVACVIIEADKLFNPNDTALTEKADRILKHFESIVKMPQMYKLVILGHADDTGDDTYSDYLTEVRANAVDEYLENLAGPQTVANIIPYGMSFEEPRYKNNSFENRSLNRRIEIYIIPEAKLIQAAKDGKL